MAGTGTYVCFDRDLTGGIATHVRQILEASPKPIYVPDEAGALVATVAASMGADCTRIPLTARTTFARQARNREYFAKAERVLLLTDTAFTADTPWAKAMKSICAQAKALDRPVYLASIPRTADGTADVTAKAVIRQVDLSQVVAWKWDLDTGPATVSTEMVSPF